MDPNTTSAVIRDIFVIALLLGCFAALCLCLVLIAGHTEALPPHVRETVTQFAAKNHRKLDPCITSGRLDKCFRGNDQAISLQVIP